MAEGELPALLALTFRALMDEVHERIAAEGFDGVRPAHGFAFQFLSVRGGAGVVELGEHLGVTKQAAVQLVDELERRGYVERRPHPSDRRARTVVLTERGRHCIDRVVAVSAEIEQRWATLIGPGELDAVRTGLGAFVADAGTRRPVTLRPVW
ncbi:MarR family transcriptional regulator [Amycolatopsis antarctica]|uniref:MarR family transcriptional regulator n=1 Tax=Amycolatopsis antarctica TaxID=1854586 RepID=A0A263CVI2_9PSEU|nr:MarR family winged helix-turn-helix transcriptional regulator [Amycolatopsis antarctica]OZM69979.1 MarR family transcriptional regulator [Amycolatopsis antarctica]